MPIPQPVCCRLLTTLPLWLTLLLTAGLSGASAKNYPSNPVRLVVSATPGSGDDVIAQVLRGALAEELGNSILIEHIPGAAGNIASTYLSRRDPDGYEMLLGSSNMTLSQLLPYARAPDPLSDFALVTRIGSLPNVIVASPRLGTRTIEALIEMARERPGDMTYASAGMGSLQHITMVDLTTANDIDMVHIPYKGGHESSIAVQSGEVDLFMASLPSALPDIRSGDLVALAVSSSERHAQLPNIPTISETIVPGFQAQTWYGVFLPLGTPQEIVTAAAEAMDSMLQRPEIRHELTEIGLKIEGSRAAEFARSMAAERDEWSTRLQLLGLIEAQATDSR